MTEAMDDRVDRLLDQFIAAYRVDPQFGPEPLLAQLSGVDRAELEARIEAYVMTTPRRTWDHERFALSPDRGLVDRLELASRGQAGSWPSLLPRLRYRARLRRTEVVAQLVERLGVADQQAKVAGYYHQMEQGLLPAQGVSQTVLQRLGEVLGEPWEHLHDAGRIALTPPAPASGSLSGSAFARTAFSGEAVSNAAASAGTAPDAPGVWDEVDRLFLGGSE